jgi:putative SOS response-associated peptidase YedK
VVLPPEHFDAWLDVRKTAPDAAAGLLTPAAEGLLEAVEMDPKINNSKVDEPGIQEPLQRQLL